jgi:myosin-5
MSTMMTDLSETSTSSAAVAAAAAAVKTSNYVYILSDEYSWIPARRLLDGSHDEEDEITTATVSVPRYKDEQSIVSDGGRAAKSFDQRKVSLNKYPNEALPLQNVNEEGKLLVVEDMVDLPFLHEAAILYNLKARHIAGHPYTRTGDIIIAVNPYQWMMDLYCDKRQVMYSQAFVWNYSSAPTTSLATSDSPLNSKSQVPPHVYEISAMAYRGLAVDGQAQSILVSGESGAGKTETVKICMNHIASIQRGNSLMSSDNLNSSTSSSFTVSPIVQRVLDSNPLLEAFGNAKTVRNDNSSRFGKYIQLQFDAEDPVKAAYAGRLIPNCVLAGSKCEVYLLEKSRVVGHDDNERTYHIFYQLLAAPEDLKQQFWPGLEDTDNESFCYVGYTETDTIEGKTDAQRFQLTVESLKLVGVTDDTLSMLFRTICVVLQLGNIVFQPNPADEERSVISSTEELKDLADLMGIPPPDLEQALTLRTVRARGEEYKVPLNAPKAKDSCDAFAKEIYAKTFLWLVRTINFATCAELNYDGDRTAQFGIIGLLDIFGFESFETNRFEQLCINYANEKLQQKFTQDIFRSVQAEYEFEGIHLDEIKYDDNTDVLDLIEGRLGLLAVLNEECVRPQGSDTAFVSKAVTMNRASPCLIVEKSFRDYEFGICHFAGKVLYDATNFVTKNQDTLPSDLQECATKSTNSILARELSNESMLATSPSASTLEENGGSTKKKKRPATAQLAAPRRQQSNLVGTTVWTKFKHQLTSLMMSLAETRTRYIRCIKPNTMKKPLIMQHVSTVEQLRCAGVVAAVTISRSAFPNRLEHEVVLDRFKSLRPMSENGTTWKEMQINLLPEDKSRVMAAILLASALKKLETVDNEVVVKSFVIGKTRTYFRAGALEHLESERLKALGRWAVQIQRRSRGFVARSQFLKKRFAAIKWQSHIRRQISRHRYRQVHSAAIVAECWYRCVLARRTLACLRRNFMATLIQSHWRKLIAVATFRINRKAVISIQALARGSNQRPKFRKALQEKREEADMAKQLQKLQAKLEEAEKKRLEAEERAAESARKAVEEYREQSSEEKKEAAPSPKSASITEISVPFIPPPPPLSGQLTTQQQTLMDESSKMLEYLRKEVFKLRSQNSQMRSDFELLKDNNQRLMDANGSAGASFAALNQHAKQLSKANSKLTADVTKYKQQIQKLNLVNVELKEELKMKQATYIAEVHSRLQYQKALTKIVDTVQERSRDSRLVENVLSLADECEFEYMSGPTGLDGNRTLLQDANRSDTSVLAKMKSFFS